MTRRPSILTGLIGLALINCPLGSLAGTQDSPPQWSLPIACEIGKTCFVQRYVDTDPGTGARDFACGRATDDGHTGTDIRLRSAASTAADVAVLAAAPGTVARTRDEMPDSRVRDQAAAKAIDDRGCGNAVVLDHGGGWTTIYCHMKRGSVAVKAGDKVERGQRLGSVGYSGLASFAHVHFEVRQSGRLVDPFSAGGGAESCATDAKGAEGMWDAKAAAALSYAEGEIIVAELTGAVPVVDALEDDDTAVPVTGKSPALVLFARFTNLLKGDVVELLLTGPGGLAVESRTDPLERNQATFARYTGKPLKLASWPTGTYEGRVRVLRGEKVHLERSVQAKID